MSTATKARRTKATRRPRKSDVKAWRTEAGELWWTCPDCRSSHDSSVNACNCGRVRPTLETLIANMQDRQVHETVCPAGVAEQNGKDDAAASNGQAATPAKQTGRRKSKAAKTPAVSAAGKGDQVARRIPVESIDLREDNPRMRIDKEALKELAQSIKRNGLQSPIVVRAKADGRFEVWQGERRLRATRDVLKQDTILAWVRPPEESDGDLIEQRYDENKARANCDPIEDAIGLQQLLDSGRFKSQRELAKAKGISQTEVSIRVRLIELPTDWQELVSSGAVPVAHVKSLLPWLDVPAVVEAARKRWQEIHDSGEVLSEREFADLVHQAARKESRTIKKSAYGFGESCPFTVTKAMHEELEVRPVPNRWGGEPEKRAFNVALWNAKAKAAKKRKSEREAKAAEKDGKPAKGAQAAALGPDRWKIEDRLGDWARGQIARRLKRSDRKLLARLAVAGVVVPDGLNPPSDRLDKSLGIKALGDTARGYWPAIAALSDAKLAALTFETVIACCGSPGWQPIADGLAIDVATSLGADPRECWQPEAEDLDLYDDKALAALVGRHGYETGKAKGRKQILPVLVKQWKPGDLPAEFLDVLENGVR